MTVNSPAPLILGTSVGVTPKEGPKCVPVVAQLAANSSVILDLTNLQQQGKISCIQGVFVDNSQNNSPVTIAVGTTGQNIVVPALSQATLPVLVAMIPIFTVSSAGGVNVPLFFTNVALYAEVWNTTAFTFTGGKLVVSDPTIEALISNQGNGNGLNVNVVSQSFSKKIESSVATVTPIVSAAAGVGKYWHITCYTLMLTGDATLATAGDLVISCQFTNGGDVINTSRFYVPSIAANLIGSTVEVINFPSPIISNNTNDTVQVEINSGSNLVTGSATFNVYGYAA